jgi:hypothetical protein
MLTQETYSFAGAVRPPILLKQMRRTYDHNNWNDRGAHLRRGRAEPASANGTRLTGESQTGVETMSGCPQRKLRLFFAPSPPPLEASRQSPKDRWRNVMFPLDI